MVNNLIYQEPFQPNLICLHSRFNSYCDAIYFSDYKMVSQELFVLLIFAGTEKIFFQGKTVHHTVYTYVPYPALYLF